MKTDLIAPLLLISNALFLGFRHGIDWDHLAAVMDIVGTTTTVQTPKKSSLRFPRNCMCLSFYYALGHGTIVATLGFLAISFAATLPKIIDPLMERVVGITLLAFGVCVFYAIYQFLSGKDELKIKSRWMFVFDACRKSFLWFRQKLFGINAPARLPSMRYGKTTAFSVGVIHGLSAETGTQILLITAVGASGNEYVGATMLAAFVLGLITSTLMLALMGGVGFLSSTNIKPVYACIGVLTGLLSFMVGGFFIMGKGDQLPELHAMLNNVAFVNISKSLSANGPI
jgi:high-affinity nickel-transport protein